MSTNIILKGSTKHNKSRLSVFETLSRLLLLSMSETL